MKQDIKLILREGLIMEERTKFNLAIPSDIQEIQNMFKSNGFKLYIVGGAVRDFLLKKKPKDFDLATDAVPDKVIEIFSNMFGVKEVLKTTKGEIEGYILKNGYRLNLQGKQFGVVAVFNIADLPEGVEIATFRKDGSSSDSRRPDSIEFTDIQGDVSRRDLTINALFYDIDTKEIVDLVGGVNDLKNGIVRTVGAPEDRFGEDRLRILRAIRFAGRFGSELDPATDAALLKDASLEGISGERIRDEFIKGLVSAKSQKQYLGIMIKYKLFDWIFPNLNVDMKVIDSLNKNEDYLVLLARLLSGNDLTVLKKRLNELKYSSDEVKTIVFLISLKLLSVDTAVALKKAQKAANVSDELVNSFGIEVGIPKNLLNAFEQFRLTVNGPEAMEITGLPQGPELGQAIHKMETNNFRKLL
jgi:tRNA nucleotidyltransferase/poly(A) polymerase